MTIQKINESLARHHGKYAPVTNLKHEVEFMLEDILDFDDFEDLDFDDNYDKDKRRLFARRRLEDRLEEKRLREELFDEFDYA